MLNREGESSTHGLIKQWMVRHVHCPADLQLEFFSVIRYRTIRLRLPLGILIGGLPLTIKYT